MVFSFLLGEMCVLGKLDASQKLSLPEHAREEPGVLFVQVWTRVLWKYKLLNLLKLKVNKCPTTSWFSNLMSLYYESYWILKKCSKIINSYKCNKCNDLIFAKKINAKLAIKEPEYFLLFNRIICASFKLQRSLKPTLADFSFLISEKSQPYCP